VSRAAAIPGDLSSAWQRAWGIAVLLCLGALYLYAPTLDYSFVADDGIYLGVKNDRLLDLPWSALHRLFLEPMNPWEFLPVRDFTYWLDASVFGKFPDGYHFSNLLWYVLTCGALYWSLGRLLALAETAPELRAKRIALALCAVVVFAYHPTHIEPVAWVSGRKDLLAGFFSILAWGSLLQGIGRNGASRWLLVSLLLFVLACFSKSVAVAVAPILFFTALASCRNHDTARRTKARLLGFSLAVAILAASSLAVHLAVGRELGIQIANDPGFFAQSERASRILAFSLRLLFVPADVRLLYDVYEIGVWHWALSAVSVGLIGLALWETLWRGRISLWAMGVLWCVLPLVTYLQWVPFSTWSMASDRFVFLSSVGGSILALALLKPLSPSRSLLFVSALAVGSATVIYARLPDWQTEGSVIYAQAAVAPKSTVAAFYLAADYANHGDGEQAMVAVNRLEREDARAVLTAMVNLLLAEKAYPLSDGLSGEERNLAYCKRRMPMVRLLDREFEKIKTERDLTYSSFLRNVQTIINPENRLRKLCEK
jgi:protein O-mannosyl-transferase